MRTLLFNNFSLPIDTNLALQSNVLLWSTCLVFQVAFSNSQAKKLAIYLSTFERHIDAVEKPNLDKEVSSLTTVYWL